MEQTEKISILEKLAIIGGAVVLVLALFAFTHLVALIF